jgi:hypothetical protein
MNQHASADFPIPGRQLIRMAMEAFLFARDCPTSASRLRAAVAAPQSP